MNDHLQFYLHPAAVEEAEQAVRWYRQRSSRTAVRFVAELNLVFDKILEAPQRWPRGIRDTRKIKLPFFPFLVIYVETEAHVHVLAIAHGSRRPGYWRNRLP